MATAPMPSGLLVGHLVARIERARAGMILMDRLCIRAQDATEPLKPEDFQDYEELSDFICGVLKAPWGSAAEGEALASTALRGEPLTGRFCR